MKKIISTFLILLFIFVQFSFILNVKAETITVDQTHPANSADGGYLITNTTTLTITNLLSSEEKFAAYKVLDAFYNSNTNVISYEFTSEFKSFLAQSETYKELTIEQYRNYDGSSVISFQSLPYLSSSYATYVRANNLTGIPMDTIGTSATTTVSAGSYLVLPTDNKYVYAVMVGNAEFSARNGQWQISSPTIAAKSDELILETYISTHVFKDIQDVLVNMDKLYIEGAFMIDSEYSTGFHANVDYPNYRVTDLHRVEILFDEGIDFLGIETILLFEGRDYGQLRIDEDGNFYHSFNEFGFQKEGLCGIIKVQSNKIIIEYESFPGDVSNLDNLYGIFTTRLNENAILGPTGNKTTTKFYYANDPYDPNSEAMIESTNVSYTYGIELQNYGEGTDKPALNNSEFEVYSDSELTKKVGDITITDGIGTLKGVADGTYYLKQTKAATGYKLSTSTISFQIDTTKDYTAIEIINEKTGFLPSTGGIGTIIYTLIGLVIIGISSLAVIYYRKKMAKI